MEGQDIKGLTEAYLSIYSESELLGEEVEVEGNIQQLNEFEDTSHIKSGPPVTRGTKGPIHWLDTVLFGRKKADAVARRRGVLKPAPDSKANANKTGTGSGMTDAQIKAAQDKANADRRAGKSSDLRGGGGNVTRPASTTTAAAPKPKPTGAADPRNKQYVKDRAAISTAKTPEAKATATKKAEKTGMDAWAKANPKLAAAKAERDRTRGTSATTNPLMKDMKSRLPAPKPAAKPAAAAPAPAAKPAAAPAPAAKPAAAPAPVVKKKPAPGARNRMRMEELDVFDIIKGHLLDEGFAETEESAMVIMANMSEEWRQDILEFLGGQKGDGMIGHPNLGIKNPMAKKQTGAKTSSSTGLASRLGNNAAKTNAAINAMRGK